MNVRAKPRLVTNITAMPKESKSSGTVLGLGDELQLLAMFLICSFSSRLTMSDH
jgi:hypothetical protein